MELQNTWSVVGISKKCPICKKQFIVRDAENHAFIVYKNNRRSYVCSWKCLQSWNRKTKSESQKRREAQIQKELRGIL